MEYKDILNKFKVVKTTGNKSKCICPTHKDKNASLSISYNENTQKTLVHCQADCKTIDILNSVNLELTDLFNKKIENDNIKKNNANIESIYDYKDINGKILFQKIRTKDKQFFLKRTIKDSIIWGLEGGIYSETYNNSNQWSLTQRDTNKQYFPLQKPILYNLPNILNAIKNDTTVFICEGEKDCITLSKMNFIATTSHVGGGKDKWLNSYGKWFKGANVVILGDNDDTGKNYAEQIQNNLKNYAYSTTIIIISDINKGDVSDWYDLNGNDRNKLNEIINNNKKQYAPWYEENQKTKNIKLNSGILANKLCNTMDYIITGNNNTNGLIHMYSNGVYELASKNWLCSEISKYIPSSLSRTSNVTDIYEQMQFKKPIKYDDINGSEDIINLKNGLYDINTKELKTHSKDYISSYQLDCEYKKEVNNLGYWDNFINDLSMGNENIKKVLQEYAGLTLSNITGNRVKKALLLNGKGDTGKSKYIEVLCRIVGIDNSINIKIQKLSDRFSLANIYGKRIVFNGDLPNSTLEDPSIFKEITGGDVLGAEFKGKDMFSFTYKGVLMFACNELPYVKGDVGVHLFDRFLIIPCTNVITEDKQNKKLINMLMADKDYVFKWALKGLERLIKQNLNFTKCVEIEEQKEQYMLQCDSVRAFILENYINTGLSTDKILATHLYVKYENYCNCNGNIPVKSGVFARRLENNLNIIKFKTGGNIYFKGIINNDLNQIVNIVSNNSNNYKEPLQK